MEGGGGCSVGSSWGRPSILSPTVPLQSRTLSAQGATSRAAGPTSHAASQSFAPSHLGHRRRKNRDMTKHVRCSKEVTLAANQRRGIRELSYIISGPARTKSRPRFESANSARSPEEWSCAARRSRMRGARQRGCLFDLLRNRIEGSPPCPFAIRGGSLG